MLNRRILRIKAMQSLYAFRQAVEASHAVAMDKIAEDYHNEWLIVGNEQLSRIEDEKSFALDYLRKKVQKERIEAVPSAYQKAVQYASIAFAQYEKQVARDREAFRAHMLSEVEMIYHQYLRMLHLLVKLSDQVDREQMEATPGSRRAMDAVMLLPLLRSAIIEKLRTDTQLAEDLRMHRLTWNPELVEEWYNELSRDEAFRSIVMSDAADRDAQIVQYLVKDFFFKSDSVGKYFEENDLNWSENRTILRSMVSKTIKNLLEANLEEVRLYTLSQNWEDDREFFDQLYRMTLANDEEYEAMIAAKSEKWAAERIAILDKIMIKMAMSEMTGFSSIPVKVTINEYVEIAKQYSTPKSWQFVNGMLDALAQELDKKGRVRKSGRGLMDNK